MSRIGDFLKETSVFFIATNDGAQPKLRPFGAFAEIDGKVIFVVGDHKAVYRQLAANPLCEIVACKPEGLWLRYTGKAVFTDEPRYAEAMLAANPFLKDIYNENTPFSMKIFYLEDATAGIINVMGEPENIL